MDKQKTPYNKMAGARADSNPVDEAATFEEQNEATPQPQPDTPPKTGMIHNANFVNVREEACRESKVLVVIPDGAVVTLICHDGEWVHVRTDEDVVGYIMADFVKI